MAIITHPLRQVEQQCMFGGQPRPFVPSEEVVSVVGPEAVEFRWSHHDLMLIEHGATLDTSQLLLHIQCWECT